jgi:hypothetical protein
MCRRIFAALETLSGNLVAPVIAMRFTSGPRAKKAAPVFAMVFLLITLLHSAAFSQSHPINASIDVSKTGSPISKYIYGQFLEHSGDIVNTGVWSEMIVDRKFFYPVDTAAPTPPSVMSNAVGNPRFLRTPTRWWVPSAPLRWTWETRTVCGSMPSSCTLSSIVMGSQTASRSIPVRISVRLPTGSRIT